MEFRLQNPALVDATRNVVFHSTRYISYIPVAKQTRVSEVLGVLSAVDLQVWVPVYLFCLEEASLALAALTCDSLVLLNLTQSAARNLRSLSGQSSANSRMFTVKAKPQDPPHNLRGRARILQAALFIDEA